MNKTVVLTAAILLAAGAATGALITNYAVKANPEGTDRVLLIDPNDPTNTKSATLESLGALFGGGPVDLTAPGPIGSVTPNTGAFTALSAQSFEPTAPDTGETGEISLLEDPANGSDAVTFKAPASVNGDLIFIVPGVDGFDGDAMVTNGNRVLSFVKMLRASNNLSDVENKPLAVTNLGAMPAPVAVPASATTSCEAPAWAFNATYLYLCPTNNTWVRVAVATW